VTLPPLVAFNFIIAFVNAVVVDIVVVDDDDDILSATKLVLVQPNGSKDRSSE
jgi:hypothetical protein